MSRSFQTVMNPHMKKSTVMMANGPLYLFSSPPVCGSTGLAMLLLAIPDSLINGSKHSRLPMLSPQQRCSWSMGKRTAWRPGLLRA